jgi:hypothetical protein
MSVKLPKPSQKIYYVKRKGMRDEPQTRKGKLREIRVEEIEQPEIKGMKREKNARREFKVRGLSEPNTELDEFSRKRQAKKISRIEQAIPSIEELKLRERLKEKALPPFEKEKLLLEREKEKALKAKQGEIITKLLPYLSSQLKELRGLGPKIEELGPEMARLVAEQRGDIPRLEFREELPQYIGDIPTDIETLFPKKEWFQGGVRGNNTTRGQIGELLGRNFRSYEDSVKALDAIDSVSLENRLQGTRANLNPNFATAIEKLKQQKQVQGKGLNFRKRSKGKGKKIEGGDFLGDMFNKGLDIITKPVQLIGQTVSHGAKAYGDIKNTIQNAVSGIKKTLGDNLHGIINDTFNKKMFGGKLKFTQKGNVSLRGLTEKEKHELADRLVKFHHHISGGSIMVDAKRGRGRPKGSKNKKLSEKLRVM